VKSDLIFMIFYYHYAQYTEFLSQILRGVSETFANFKFFKKPYYEFYEELHITKICERD
jgi:hypothetical protein